MGMRQAAGEYVDAFWASTLPFAPGGDDATVIVGAHRGCLTGYEGVYTVDRRGHVVISAPPHLVSKLQEKVPGADTAMDPAWWLTELPGWIALGPSVHSFLDDVRSLPRAEAVERATVAQIADALRRRVTAAQWSEGGFGGTDVLEAWLLRDDSGRPVAAANLTPFNGIPADVGLITATDSRGRGYGRAVGAEAVRWAVDHHGIARWRALESNLASRRVAAALGFADDCRQLAARPAP
jgi:RimJ/RimL family protein N-acetyltransferase